MATTHHCPALTGRELEILGLAAEGRSAKEIAKILAIAHRTVECHLDTSRLKLRARNRTHMVAIAMALDLLPVLAPHRAQRITAHSRGFAEAFA